MKNKELIFSAIFYGLGLLCLLLADLYVSNNYSKNFIADWAFFKSSIIIVGSISMFGYDQVFIRNQDLIKSYSKVFIKNLLFLSAVVVTFIYFFKNESFINLLKLFFTIICFSILTYFSASSRAAYNLWKSQFSTNFWKIILFPCLVLLSLSSIDYFLIAMVISLLLSYFLKGFLPRSENVIESNISKEQERKIAQSFMFTSLTLLFSTYGEQFVINLFNKEELSSEIFKYYAYFTPIAFSINGFIGFILAPKIRKLKKFSVNDFNKLNLSIFLLSLICCVVSFIGGYLYVKFVLKTNFKLDIVILTLLFVLSLIRGLYTATSVCLGVFGDYFSIRKTAIGFWISVFLYLGILLITLFFNLKYSIYIVIFATLINWTMRLLISNYFSYKSLKQINYEAK